MKINKLEDPIPGSYKMTHKIKACIKILIIGIVTVVNLFISSWANDEEKGILYTNTANDIQLTIKSDKKVYNIPDSMEIQLIFVNVSNKELYLGIDLHYLLLKLNIFDENNEKCSGIFTVIYDVVGGKEDFHLIQPKQEYKVLIKTKIEKEEHFKKGNLILNGEDYAIVLGKKGKFYITAEYNDSEFYGEFAKEFDIENVFRGNLVSNKIEIEIR